MSAPDTEADPVTELGHIIDALRGIVADLTIGSVDEDTMWTSIDDLTLRGTELLEREFGLKAVTK